MKKYLALLLALLCTLTSIPVFAADSTNEFIIEGDRLVKYVGNGGDVVIPDGIRVIGESAFMAADLIEEQVSVTSVSIPDSVTTIERGAFVNCSDLKEVFIPDSVTEVGDYAFYGAGCKTIRIPENLQNFGHYSFFAFPFFNTLWNEDGMIIINNVLVEIDAQRYKYPSDHLFVVPNGISKLRLGNFGELNALMIPDSCTDIGDLYNDEGHLCITVVYGQMGAVWEDSLPNGTIMYPVRVAQNAMTLTPGKKAQLIMNYQLTDDKVVYKSSNPKVASVSKNGKVTAKKGGKTTITATYCGITTTCEVTVAGRYYIVKRGDSLWSIASKQLGSGYRWREIVTLNRLGNKTIHAGKKLYLPER